MDIKKLAVIVGGSALLVGIFLALRNRAEPRPVSERTVRIEVTVRNETVMGGVRRADIRRGSRVVIVVEAPDRDRVHVHGYERYVSVEPGSPSRLAFRATTSGSFEVELEESGLLLVTLDVR